MQYGIIPQTHTIYSKETGLTVFVGATLDDAIKQLGKLQAAATAPVATDRIAKEQRKERAAWGQERDRQGRFRA